MSSRADEVHDGALLITETSASLWILMVMVRICSCGEHETRKNYGRACRGGTVVLRFLAEKRAIRVQHETHVIDFSQRSKYDLLKRRFDWPIYLGVSEWFVLSHRFPPKFYVNLTCTMYQSEAHT